MASGFRLRRIQKFFETFSNISLHEYYGIPNVIIETGRKEKEIFVTVHFKKQCPCYDIPQLPIELNRLIASYNEAFIVVKAKIMFGEAYPFDRPVWILLDVKHNVRSLNLRDYYQYILDNHNNQYSRYWTPAIDIEKDILEFIQKINHFQYFIEE